MEAILFSTPFLSEAGGNETVVVYTMGLRKWIYVPGLDIAVALVAEGHYCNDNWLLQKCSLLSETDMPPISPFCVKERYTDVAVTLMDGGFTLVGPNLGHLLFSRRPLSRQMEQALPQESAAVLKQLEDQLKAQSLQSQSSPTLLLPLPQQPSLPKQPAQLPQPSLPKQQQGTPPRQIQVPPLQHQQKQQQQRRPLPVLPILLQPPILLPYSNQQKPSPSSSGPAGPQPGRTGTGQKSNLQSASLGKTHHGKPKPQYPVLRAPPSLNNLTTPS